MMKKILFISSFSFISYNEKKKILDYICQNGYYNDEELIKRFQIKKEVIEKISFKDINNYQKLHNIKIVSMNDKEYPKQLLTIDQPPFILFCKGEVELLNSASISVIGSRKNSEYGKRVTKYLVKELVKKDITIVSGLAYGIDGIAHKETLRYGGKTIAILGSGFKNIYPCAHQNLANNIIGNGCLVSEYPCEFKPRKYYFPFRNRIISGLSNGLLVVEGRKKSGTLITTEYALNQGKNVFAVPHNIDNESGYIPNLLIKEGAIPVINYEDLVDNLK